MSSERVPLTSPQFGDAITSKAANRGAGIPTSRKVVSDAISGSATTNRFSTPISSPRLNKAEWDDGSGWDDPGKPVIGPASPAISSLTGLSKEEKAAELAKRKEERKQVRRRRHVFIRYY